MIDFMEKTPEAATCWRSIILFGRNTTSYKFALAKSLIELGSQEKELLSLDELAKPFSLHICHHLKKNPAQTAQSPGKFLKACIAYNAQEMNFDELLFRTQKEGFRYVIEHFHVVNQGNLPTSFFIDERQRSGGIRLTETFFNLLEHGGIGDLGEEIEARWRLVETAWSMGISRKMASINHDASLNVLFAGNTQRRVAVTSSRSALNGYQKGRCFYCFDRISILEGDARLADVDHFFPHVLKGNMLRANLDGIWNLVLACKKCNGGRNGKFAKLPTTQLLARLHSRNEFLIASHHPLRETLIRQTGKNEAERRSFLQSNYDQARDTLIHTWEPTVRARGLF